MEAAPPAKKETGGKCVTGREIAIGIGAALIVAVIAAIIIVIAHPGSSADDASSFEATFPPGGPAEFLYLDTNRVATYLAQVEGGKVESEKLTRKLTQSLGAKLTPKELGDVEATKARELSAERTVKPTAASSFFSLRTRLEDAGVVSEIRPRYFEKDVEPLREGTFVEFKTSALLSPIYINAYLAVLHAGTLAAIFPDSTSKQAAAKAFFNEVGPTGRAVFALQPYKHLPDSASQGRLGRKPFVYLLPITAPLLTSERSLIKYGGGTYTVLGKLVRRFPEPTSNHHPAYVDSATDETWERAIELAPGELLCRTTPACARAVRRGHGLKGPKRTEEVEATRTHILKTLKEQTTIPNRGAVILPIGIYK
jgi:hypothetical protein